MKAMTRRRLKFIVDSVSALAPTAPVPPLGTGIAVAQADQESLLNLRIAKRGMEATVLMMRAQGTSSVDIAREIHLASSEN